MIARSHVDTPRSTSRLLEVHSYPGHDNTLSSMRASRSHHELDAWRQPYAPSTCAWNPPYSVLFPGATGRGSDMPSLSAEDLIMAVHKASSRRIEVLSRTTGNVDEV